MSGCCKALKQPVRVSIIVLTKNGEKYLESVLAGLFSQVGVEQAEVILIDSGSSDRTLDIASRFPVVITRIAPEEFGHGRTRNLGARLSRGELLVYLPQDATPVGSHWLEALIAPLADATVAGVYCRQVPREDASAMEKFFLRDMYGDDFALRRLEDGRASLSRCFFSTVGGAIRASFWRDHPFREDVIMSEDQAWSRELMLSGYAIAYQPAAAVLHSHHYGVAEVFRRNFDSGFSIRQIHACRTGIPAVRVLSSIAREAAFVLREGSLGDMACFPVYEASRHLGFWLGMHAERLPLKLRKACGNLTYFWDRSAPEPGSHRS